MNFNDDFYLDLDKDFSSSVPELKEALERIDSRGSTALYDAVIGSLDHLKKAHKDKRVLLVVTDGEDNTSHNSLDKAIKEVQKTDTVIYTIGLLSEESKKNSKRAKKALEQLAQASGGLAFFPENVDDVRNICEQVARDIRNQYTLAYYPTNTKRDGTFRAVQVEVIPPRGRGRLVARTRNGYYAPGGADRDGEVGGFHLKNPTSMQENLSFRQFIQKTFSLRYPCAENFGDRLPHVGERLPDAQVGPGGDCRRVRQNGHVFARVIGGRPARIGIAAVVRGDQQQVGIAQLREKFSQPGVKLLQ